jgi:hypothetical protein
LLLLRVCCLTASCLISISNSAYLIFNIPWVHVIWITIDELQFQIKKFIAFTPILLSSYFFRGFAIARPALDCGIPLPFEIAKGISVEFVIEGVEVRNDCDGCCG